MNTGNKPIDPKYSKVADEISKSVAASDADDPADSAATAKNGEKGTSNGVSDEAASAVETVAAARALLQRQYQSDGADTSVRKRAFTNGLANQLPPTSADPAIAQDFNEYMAPYGRQNAKIDAYGWLEHLKRTPDAPRKHGVILLVTSDTPLKASRGEGKTTALMALVDALRANGIDAGAVLRQPSMGITAAGSKGGASGAGKASLLQPDLADWGLFGEMSRIATAQNLIVVRGEKMLLEDAEEPGTMIMPRVSELPSKESRRISVGQGLKDGKRSGGFAEKTVLTPTSEMMEIVTLSRSVDELRRRISRMIVGQKADGTVVLAKDVVDIDRVLRLLSDSIQPALLQTLNGSPVYVHCGPFGNVSLGIPSLVAIETAQSLHDVVVVEAGYGTDAGAQKLLDIACRYYGLDWPSAAVIVARASTWDTPHLGWRFAHHIHRLEKSGIPTFPLINLWSGDEGKTDALRERGAKEGLRKMALTNLYEQGSDELAGQIDDLMDTLTAAQGHQANANAHKPSDLRGTSILSRVEGLCEESYGVPAERVTMRDDYEPSLKRSAALAKGAGASLEDLVILSVKSPATITDDDTLPADQRTVQLKMSEVHAGAGLLHLHLTKSLTTSMPRIVD